MELTPEQIERLRQSGLRLDANGVFWHEGAPVTHHGLVAAFYRWLDRNPDGRYVLRLDERRFVYLDVDDLPLVVRSLRWDHERAIGVLSDGSEQEIDLSTLHIVGERAEVRVRKELPARLANAAWTTLGEHLVEQGDQLVLKVGARELVVPRRPR